MTHILAVGAVLALCVVLPWIVRNGRIPLMVFTPLVAVGTAILTAPASLEPEVAPEALSLYLLACYAVAVGCHAAIGLGLAPSTTAESTRRYDQPKPRLVR